APQARQLTAGDPYSVPYGRRVWFHDHIALGAAAPQQRVIMTPGGQPGAPPHLLPAGDADRLSIHKPVWGEIHHAGRVAAPQERVRVAPGGLSGTVPHLLSAEDAVRSGIGKDRKSTRLNSS